MAKLEWKNVSRQHPCSICGKPDWCSFTTDGSIADCMREQGPGGIAKTNSVGQVYYRHFSGGGTGNDEDNTELAQVEPQAMNHKRRADVEVLDAVYTDLLDSLCVYQDHIDHLRDERGLSQGEFTKLGYRSFPHSYLDRQKVVDKLRAKFDDDVLTSVPGFDRPPRELIELESGATLDPTEVRLCGSQGYLLPQRDDQGRIVSLVLRRDLPEQGEEGGEAPESKPSRYLPFTSYHESGAAAQVGLHLPLHAQKVPTKVRVIEGIIKADIATMRTDTLTIGMQNGGRWKPGVKLAELLGAEQIILTPDADTRTNKTICMTLVNTCIDLAAQGTDFVLETWEPELGKGLDDAIVAGHRDKVIVHEGAGVWQVLKEWLHTCGAERDARVEARINLDGIVAKTQADHTYPFKPMMAEWFAWIEPSTVEGQRLLPPLKKALGSSSFRDLESRISKARAQVNKKERTARLQEKFNRGEKVFDRGDEAELSLTLLDDLTPVSGGWKSNHELAVFDGGRLHVYDAELGIYQPIHDADLRVQVAEYAGSPVMAKKLPLSVSSKLAKGTVNLAHDRRNKPGFFHAAPKGITFRNGFLRVDPIGKTVKLVAHHPDQRVRVRYDFDYRPGVVPKRLLKAMRRWFGNKAEMQLYIDCIQEFIGATLVGLAPTFGKILMLTGQGNDGKSTFIKIVIGLMPEGAVSNVAPQSLHREYNRAELEGKVLNVVLDLPEQDLLDSGPLKAVTVGDPIEARFPHGRVFTLKSIAAMLFAVNNLFKTRDTTPAFRRRWILFEFDNPIGAMPGEVANEHLAEEILTEEREAVVSWAIDGLIRRLQDGKYTVPAASDAAVAEWLGENDTVAQFAEDCLVELVDGARRDNKQWVKGKAVYDAYKEWCTEHGHGRPLSSIKFLKRLRTHLKLDKKEGHRRDGNYYPVQLRPSHVSEKAIASAEKVAADIKGMFEAERAPMRPAQHDDREDDEAARNAAYAAVYGFEGDIDVDDLDESMLN